jgi:hypothetical protein
MRPRRPFIGRPTLLVAVVALILGATVEAAPARSASAGIGSAPVAKLLARGAESLAGQIIGDYEFRHGTPNERSIFHGPAGLDVITLGYNAHDSIDGKAGEYVLIVSVRQSPGGQPDPDRLVAEKVDVYPGTGKNVSSFPIYTYTVAPTLDHGEQAWEVIVKIHEGRNNDLYDYTTGKPEAGHWLKLTAAAFQSLSAQALSILKAAPHHADIRTPSLPFPAPFVGTGARSTNGDAGARAAGSASLDANTLAAHDAAILAARIRKDARRASGSPSAEVHVETGCCGVRVLTVLYRARPTRGGKYGAYVVQLVTGRGGTFTSAALLELRTARGYRYGEPQTKLLYQFGLFRKAPPNWGITTYPANDTIAPSATPLPPGATKQLTPAELEAAFSQALAVLARAESRAPVSTG